MTCPSCDAPLDGDERFCLQCGHRLVPAPQPKPSWRLPVVIIGSIALATVGATLFALQRVSSDAEREARKPAPVVTQPPANTQPPASTPGDKDKPGD